MVVDAGDSTRLSQLCQMRGALVLLVGFESSTGTLGGPDPNRPPHGFHSGVITGFLHLATLVINHRKCINASLHWFENSSTPQRPAA